MGMAGTGEVTDVCSSQEESEAGFPLKHRAVDMLAEKHKVFLGVFIIMSRSNMGMGLQLAGSLLGDVGELSLTQSCRVFSAKRSSGNN